MKRFFLDIFEAAGLKYRNRFFVFTAILYSSTVLVEFANQVIIEENLALRYVSSFYSPLHPYLFIPALLGTFFAFLGFAALYVSFGGVGIKEAVVVGFRNLHRYGGLFVCGTAIVLVFFFGVPLLFSFILRMIEYQPPTLFADPYAMVITFPLILLSLAPAAYALISFAIAPFILLFEKQGIIRSLRLSYARMNTGRFFRSALLLVFSFIVLAIAYHALRWIIFEAKLALIPDLSFRLESILRVFVYSVPWVLTAVFFDLIVYELYLRLMPRESAVHESDGNRVQRPDAQGEEVLHSPEPQGS